MSEPRFAASAAATHAQRGSAGIALRPELEVTEPLRHGMRLIEVAPAVEHSIPFGSVLGGWIAGLLDSAMRCAVMTRPPTGQDSAAPVSLEPVLRPAVEETGPQHATGHGVHAARRAAAPEGRPTRAAGWLEAAGPTTRLVMELAP